MEVVAQPEVNVEELQQEDAKVEAAKAELAIEENGGVPPELNGILAKYENDPVKLAAAFKSLQAEYTKVRQGGAPEEPPAEPQAEEVKTEDKVDDAAEKARSEAVIAKVKELAGSERELRATLDWAKDNLDPKLKEQYEEAIHKGTPDQVAVLWQAIAYQKMMKSGYEPKLVGGRQTAGDDRPFQSQGQIQAALSDSKYKEDEAYRNEVYRRLAVTPDAVIGMRR